MHLFAISAFAALAAAQASSVAAPQAAPPAGVTLELEGRPLRVAVLETGGGMGLLLLGERGIDQFRFQGRRLVPTGRHPLPNKTMRPLLLDATPNGGKPLVTLVLGEDVESVDRGTDTLLHGFVLTAREDGGLAAASDDLGGWLRITEGGIRLQRRGPDDHFRGPVRDVPEASGRYVAGAEKPWAGRWLLDATPVPGGSEALAWDRDRPIVVKRADGARVPGGSIVGDLGTFEGPSVAIRVDRPIFKGLDRDGRNKDSWLSLPRRVSVAADGAAYTVQRGRSRRFVGKASGQDAVVRLDWSDGALALSRPFPGVDAFVLDFAIVHRLDGRAVAILLVNEKEDGSGRAHLVVQESGDARP